VRTNALSMPRLLTRIILRCHLQTLGIMIVVSSCTSSARPIPAQTIFIAHFDRDSLTRDSTGRQVAALVGAVVDSIGESPLEATQILLRPSGNLRSHFSYTDKRGTFALARVEPGSYTVLVRRIGYLPHIEQRNLTANVIDTMVVRLKQSGPCVGGIECY
jgi:hypothetical protein